MITSEKVQNLHLYKGELNLVVWKYRVLFVGGQKMDMCSRVSTDAE